MGRPEPVGSVGVSAPPLRAGVQAGMHRWAAAPPPDILVSGMSPAGPQQSTPRRGPGRPRIRPVDEERALVLTAARRVFASAGFEGATIEAVAREAGVPRPTVYDHFGGKSGLFEAVVQDAVETMSGLLDAALHGDPDVPWPEIVRRSYAAAFTLAEEHADAVAVLIHAGAGMGGARRRVLASLAERARVEWSRLGVDIGAGGEITATMLYGMAEAVALRYAEEGGDRDALIDLLTEFTIGGLIRLGEEKPEVLKAINRPRAPRRARPGHGRSGRSAADRR